MNHTIGGVASDTHSSKSTPTHKTNGVAHRPLTPPDPVEAMVALVRHYLGWRRGAAKRRRLAQAAERVTKALWRKVRRAEKERDDAAGVLIGAVHRHCGRPLDDGGRLDPARPCTVLLTGFVVTVSTPGVDGADVLTVTPAEDVVDLIRTMPDEQRYPEHWGAQGLWPKGDLARAAKELFAATDVLLYANEQHERVRSEFSATAVEQTQGWVARMEKKLLKLLRDRDLVGVIYGGKIFLDQNRNHVAEAHPDILMAGAFDMDDVLDLDAETPA